MKTFKSVCAQGDVMFVRMDDGFNIPANAEIVPPEPNGHLIITRSETLHHHVVMASNATLYRLPDSIMDYLLVVGQPTALEHLREFDTHEPILFEPGVYHVRRQREYTPEGFRRVED